ncbi:hypothetical protein HanRHA438_Chr02g0088171 [Helianthus annuus]|nr:hypothetical protein HanRHA438_Chr02g0088171 [Helianthus annuus]
MLIPSGYWSQVLFTEAGCGVERYVEDDAGRMGAWGSQRVQIDKCSVKAVQR